jgi:sugar phosphate isomerase/epimerase
LLGFTGSSLESALRTVAEMEFTKVELAIMEDGPHLRPSEIADNPEAALHRLRSGPSLMISSFDLDFGAVDPDTFRRRFDAICRFAKPLLVAVLTIPAAPAGTPIEDEVRRLSELSALASREGLVLCVKTAADTLTADPSQTAALCRAVPGLGLTLDPSPYLEGPRAGAAGGFDELFPFVKNIHLRDTGRKPSEFQVRVGQGQIEYGRIVSQLERVGYNHALTVAYLDSIPNPFEVEVEIRKLKLLLESLL